MDIYRHTLLRQTQDYASGRDLLPPQSRNSKGRDEPALLSRLDWKSTLFEILVEEINHAAVIHQAIGQLPDTVTFVREY